MSKKMSLEELKKFYDHQVELRKKYSDRRRIRLMLCEKKCLEIGYVITDSMIDEELKKLKK